MSPRKRSGSPKCLHQWFLRRPVQFSFASTDRGLPSFTNLNDGLLPADFKNLTSSYGSIGQGELDDLVVGWKLASTGARGLRYRLRTETLSRTTNGLRVSTHAGRKGHLISPINSCNCTIVCRDELKARGKGE